MKYITFTLIMLVSLVAASPARAATSSLSISEKGVFSANNVVVLQKNGTNLFCRVSWGDAYVRITILTTPGGAPAKIIKNHGGVGTVDDISEGDLLSVQGTLALGADNLLINATKIVDYAANFEQKTVAGTINALGQGVLTLRDKNLGTITLVASSTATMTKGKRTITMADLKIGDKIISASGLFDYSSNTLSATTIVVYQDSKLFVARNFQGTIERIDGTTLPTSLLVSSEGEDYRVFLAAGVSVFSSNKTKIDLNRFAVGDKVRIYGSIRQTDITAIDADTIRDLNF
ncbi:MAG: hypothetical protein KGI70_00990 [Patescibacteria group bacterium]|nr:hypothetical protein [Patescibacteria group bacterium]